MTEIICSMCGHSFDPAAHMRCTECPIKKGCQLTCCPKCGYETVDLEQSSIVRFASRAISTFSSGGNKHGIEPASTQET